jgi:phosphatidylserine synthase
VAGFIWLSSEYKLAGLTALVMAFVVTTLIGLLMVSSFAYRSLKEFNPRGRVRWAYMLIIPVVFIVIMAGPEEALCAIFAIYSVHAPIVWLWRKVFHRRHRGEQLVKP